MRELGNRLGTRLAVLLTLALAPLGSIAIYSEYSGWRTQRAASEADLIARTIDTVAGQRALLESAMLSIDSLSPMVADRIDDPAACSELLADFIASSGFYSFSGFIDTNGVMACVSEGSLVDFGQTDEFSTVMASPRSFFSFRPSGAVTGQPVVLASRPVFHNDELLGFLSVSISRRSFELIATSPDTSTAPSIAYLVNHQGQTLTNGDDERAADLLPAEGVLTAYISQRNGVFFSRSVSGSARLFTVAELVSGQLYALGSWNAERLPNVWALSYWSIGFPLLMWLASVAVVMFAMSYMVVRHLRHINGQLRRFALGDRADFQRLPEQAPTELREINSTFIKMARLIRRDELEREEALKEKTILLREVHHRVKNNLQLIASILNLQIRRISDADARAILLGVQSRVRSLASIHRTLYEQSRISDSHATEFFESILRETLSMAQPDQTGLEVDKQFEAVSLPPDKIIPAALLFAEALTNALKNVSAPRDGGTPKLKVSLLASAGDVELRLWNSLSEPAVEMPDSGLGHELMTAFALQIHGDLALGPTEDEAGHGWEIRLRLSNPEPKQDDGPVAIQADPIGSAQLEPAARPE